MQRVVGYVSLKHKGIHSSTCCLVGHIGIEPNTKHKKFDQVIKYLDKVLIGSLLFHFRNDNSSWVGADRNENTDVHNCSMAFSFGGGPDFIFSLVLQ